MTDCSEQERKHNNTMTLNYSDQNNEIEKSRNVCKVCNCTSFFFLILVMCVFFFLVCSNFKFINLIYFFKAFTFIDFILFCLFIFSFTYLSHHFISFLLLSLVFICSFLGFFSCMHRSLILEFSSFLI